MEDFDDDIDYEVEWKLRAIAVPVAFVLALAFHAWGTGHWLQRTFLTMLPHEFGHAITAWLTGHIAIPSLWKTITFEGRSIIAIVVSAAVAGLLIWRGWRNERHVMLGFGLAIGALQLWLATASPTTQQAAITFGGDGGAMVIGALLVICFHMPWARRGQLRWGLLVIGAAAFTDTFATWWSARSDRGAIPFGEIEGVGQSDPSKLQDVYGWAVGDIVGRYVLLGGACLLAIAAVTAWAAYTARRAAQVP